MEKTNRELLIKDISSRLPYGVKAEVMGWDEEKEKEVFVPVTVYSVNTDGYVYFANNDYDITYCSIDACRLYLRPMSSMTEEELNECVRKSGIKDIQCPNWQDIPKEKQFEARLNHAIAVFLTDSNSVDWLNAHHFDYRGLISMKLALEAPEGMYK